jgi:hypothetical protein
MKRPSAELRVELLFFGAILGLYFLWFYSRWPLTGDHTAISYVAWGLLHGFSPYVDIIEADWPANLLIHSLAWLIYGPSPFGLRLVDGFLILVLCIATSRILACWDVPRGLRFLSISIFLVMYFGADYGGTAQKEGMGIALCAPALLLWLRWPESDSRMLLPLSGSIAGMSIAIKPVFAVLWAWVFLYSIYRARSERIRIGRAILRFAIGFVILGGVMVLFLSLVGSLRGFVEWGVVYLLTEHSQAPYGADMLLQRSWLFLAETYTFASPNVWVLLLLPIVLVFQRTRGQLRLRSEAVTFSLGLFAACFAQMWVQGRGFSNHFVPVHWSSALLLGVLLSCLPRPLNAVRFDRAMIVLASVICLGFGVEFKIKGYEGALPGALLARRIGASLRKDETVVTYGFQTIGVLPELKRPTPYPFSAAAGMYGWAAQNSPTRKRLVAGLIQAIQHPSVRYFVVEGRILRNQLLNSAEVKAFDGEMLLLHRQLMAVLGKEYRLVGHGILGHFVLFERERQR